MRLYHRKHYSLIFILPSFVDKCATYIRRIYVCAISFSYIKNSYAVVCFRFFNQFHFWNRCVDLTILVVRWTDGSDKNLWNGQHSLSRSGKNLKNKSETGKKSFKVPSRKWETMFSHIDDLDFSSVELWQIYWTKQTLTDT